MKKKVTTICRFLAFVMLLCLITLRVYNVLSWKESAGIEKLNTTYLTPNADVLFFGASHSYCTINTAILWEEYGIAADDYSEGGQNYFASYYYMKEALKRERPKVVFLELRGLLFEKALTNGNLYRNTINVKWSENFLLNKREEVEKQRQWIKPGDNIEEMDKGITLKFPIIHARYNELTEDDFRHTGKKLRYRSSYGWSVMSFDKPDTINEKKVAELSEKEKRYLHQLVQLSEDYGFQLVLWVAPYVPTSYQMRVFNAVEQFAKDNNIHFVNFFSLLAETGFDYETDLRYEEKDKGSHLNHSGAKKVTEYYGKILREEFHVADHRGDEKYHEYDEAAAEWDEAVAVHNLGEEKTLSGYINLADKRLFDVAIIEYNNNKEVSALTNYILKTDKQGYNLYSNGCIKQINGRWRVSDKVVLVPTGNQKNPMVMYSGSQKSEIVTCDICMIITSKKDGSLVNKAEFKWDKTGKPELLKVTK